MAAFGVKTSLVAMFVLVSVVTMMSPQVEGITCGNVASSLSPCINYLTGKGPLAPGCCAGVKKLNGMAQTTPDRQTACNCLKSTAANIKGINMAVASSLPGKCGVNIPYKISPSTDCSTIH